MKTTLSLLILICSVQVKAQQFQELIHLGTSQEAKHMAYAVGGGYLLASNFTDSAGEKSILLTRLDNQFQVVWHNTIDETGTVERVNSFAQDASGNIFIAGNIEDSFATAFYKSVVIKTDSTGNLIWEKILNYSDYNNLAYLILPAASGSIYVVGEAKDDIDNEVAYRQYLLKLNSSGGIQLARDYQDSWHSTHSSQILKSSDDKLIVSGWSTTLNGDVSGLTKFDTTGTKIWDNRWFGGYAQFNASEDMTYTDHGGYMLVGWKDTVDSTYVFRNFITEVDSLGSQVSVMRYGFSGGGAGYFHKLQSTKTYDGGYAAAGLMDYPSKAIALFKVDSDLIPQWSMLYDTGYINSIASLLQTTDGGYLIAGSLGDNILLIKTDANGLSLCNEQALSVFYQQEPQTPSETINNFQNISFNSILYQPVVNAVANGTATTDTLCSVFTSSPINKESFSFSLFPDPANEIINVSFHDYSAQPISLLILNTIEEQVESKILSGDENSIDISRLPAGIYSAILSNRKNIAVRKFVKVTN